MNKLSRAELQAQDGIIPGLHPNKQNNEDCHTWNVRTNMYVCTGKEYTGMNDQINKQRNKFNQFLIDKTNYQVHAPTETKQSLITMKLTKP